MARPQTIFIDPDKLLLGIARAWWACVEALEEPIPAARRRVAIAMKQQRAANDARQGNLCYEASMAASAATRKAIEERDYLAVKQRQRDDLDRCGIDYDLARFLGRSLSPSELVRAGQAMRSLERVGLIVLTPRRATA